VLKKTIIALISTILFFAVIATGYLIDQAFVPANDGMIEESFINPGSQNNPGKLPEKKDGPIVVGIFNSGYLYHESHDHGINKDIIVELFKRMKLDYKIEILPRVRITSMMTEGSVHVGVTTVETPERAEYMYFVPYFAEKNEVLVRKDANISTEKELLQRWDIKVGIVRGYYYGEHYTELIEKLKSRKMIVEAKDTEHLYQMLGENWIQVTFNNASSYLFYLDFYSIPEINIYDWAPEEGSLVRNLAFNKQYFSAGDVAEFQKTVDKMINDGTIYNVFKKYLPEVVAKRMCIPECH
jgi:polar amino acid transport system substrate-binding protein